MGYLVKEGMVMKLKQMVMRILLLAEMALFTHMYVFGKSGLQLLRVQKIQLTELSITVAQLQKEVGVLESEMNEWEIHDFYKEKVAREQLQMARKGDKLFYIGS